MYKNVFYFQKINAIGGIETFFYELAKKYSKWDITVFYKFGNAEQVKRLKQYVRVRKWTNEKIKCDKLFCNFNTEIIDFVEANEYNLIVHGDYKAMVKQGQLASPPRHPKINNYYGVSQIACDSFTELTGIPCNLTYNPIENKKSDKALRLISATRLTSEKGKNRMIKLGETLDNKGIKYNWLIFTDDTNEIKNPNIAYMKPRLDIRGYISSSDYLIQLSDNEGYCYSVVESLINKVPVVVTDLPVFNELGLNETNSIKLNLDCSNIENVAEKMAKGGLKVEYTPPKDNWLNILSGNAGDSTYEIERNEKVKARTLIEFFDKEARVVRTEGEEFELTRERYETINNVGQAELHKDIVEEIKEEIKDEIVAETEYLPKKEETKKEIVKATRKKK